MAATLKLFFKRLNEQDTECGTLSNYLRKSSSNLIRKLLEKKKRIPKIFKKYAPAVSVSVQITVTNIVTRSNS